MKNYFQFRVVIPFILAISVIVAGYGMITYVKLIYSGDLPVSLFPSTVVSSSPIIIEQEEAVPGNQLQPNASVQLTVCDHKLYMYMPMNSPVDAGPYEGYVSSFESNGIQRIKFITNHVIGLWGGNLYYTTDIDTTGTSELVCHQLSSQTDTTVFGSDSHDMTIEAHSCWVGPNGTWYYPVVRSGYYCVQGNTLTVLESIVAEYQYGNITYTFFRGNIQGKYASSIIAKDVDGNVIKDYSGSFGSGTCRIIPCDLGLVIHNDISSDMLYFICGETGEIVELFSVEGERTISSANVYGDYVYLSFVRYKDYNQLWFGCFENDTLEGTWKINLKDYGAEKLNDQIYNGLYIFDNTGIYACDDQHNLYKLDFDGNVIMTLLKH